MSPIPCPACGRFLPAQSPTSCPGCHLPLTGPDAARLWQVDQSLAALQLERTSLIAALRSRTTSPATAAAPSTDVSPLLPSQVEPLTTAPAAPPRRSWTTQQTLLAVGVLLVLIAASIALAIAWFLIGRIGQMVVMGGFTAAAVVAALQLSRRNLPSSAEALAIVAGGLLLLDVSAARRFGLANLDALDGRTYAAITGLLVAVLLAVLHRPDRRIAGFALLRRKARSSQSAS